ncbi:MAG: amidohydrolase/deacetylase family metallohydrolase [Chloroflexi bacterium]|nr:MAG: amidohydrolase/deacetylase family metallohydrolase [Chloroflexota bacterium]
MQKAVTDLAPPDLIIRRARVIDPAQEIDRIADIAVREGKIAGIGDYSTAESVESVDASGCVASPGWIDLHAHVFTGGSASGIHPDEDAGVAAGVTTVVDAGSAGFDTWPAFRETIQEVATTRVLAFLNVSTRPTSGPRHGEWSNFAQGRTIPLAEQEAAAGYCLGIKVLASQTHCGNLGITPVKLARQAARLSGAGLMVHIGNAPPVIEEVLELLEAGDIVTHCWHGKYGGLLGRDKKPLPATREAVARGVKFDLGHGSASFAFETARHALDAGLPLHAISTDLHRGCLNGPVYDMATTMAKCLHLGFTLPEVIRLSTWSPAQLIRREETLGALATGREADITVFRLVDGEFDFTDSERRTERANQHLEVRYTIRAGRIVKTPSQNA